MDLLGKYLNVIQQCDKEISWPDDVEDIVYLTNPEHYVLPLEKAYAFASKTLLDLLVKDRDLIGENSRFVLIFLTHHKAYS